MTHRSQMSLTSVMATLYFCLSGNNGRHPPPTKLSAFLTVGQKHKNPPSNYHISFTFAKQIATPATCGCPWRLPETTCVNPLPPQMHTHTHGQPGVTGAEQLRGSQNQKYKSWKLKDLQMGHLPPPLSLSLSLAEAGMLLIKQPPQPGTTDAD